MRNLTEVSELAIGEAIKAGRVRRQMTQEQLGAAIFKSPTWISKFEHGERDPDPDTLAHMVEVLDDPRCYLAAMEHVTRGLFGSTLDGIEQSRSAALLCAKVELEEAQTALREAKATLLQCPTRAKREQIIELIMEAMDARAALNQLLVCLCGEYGLSLRELGKRHEGRLLQLGYKKGRSVARAA